MLKPFVIVGVGGSGGKTIRALREILKQKLDEIGWQDDFPACWQLIHVDSPVNQESGDTVPFEKLPDDDYVGLVGDEVTYGNLYNKIFTSRSIQAFKEELEKPLPDPTQVPTNITIGAGRYRAIGRVIALSRISEISKRVVAARNIIASSLGDLKSLSQKFGIVDVSGRMPDTQLIVISSMAGGSGAGQFLEVTEAMKSFDPHSMGAGEIFSILYAPDIFDELSRGGKDPSFSANTLMTISEVMSGIWSGGFSENDSELYKSQGVNSASDNPRVSVGAAFNYIVGRKNTAGVDFRSQLQAYRAVAQSISKWMTDKSVQADLTQYAVANWHVQAAGAIATPDISRLKDDNSQAPAFSSFGFGRVSLGMQNFKTYASERLAKSVIETLLHKHAAEDPKFKQKTEDEWVEYNAKSAFISFINELRLNEETESNNQILDAMKPDITALKTEFVSKLRQLSSQGLDKNGGKSLQDWSSSILYNFNNNIANYSELVAVARHSQIRDWVASIQMRLQEVVARYTAQYGLLVTASLLGKLEQSLRNVQEEMKHEATKHESWANTTDTNVSSALHQAQGQPSIRPDHEVIEQAIGYYCGMALEWQSDAALRNELKTLLEDFVDGVVAPLRKSLKDGHTVLKRRIEQPNPLDRHNFPTWPEGDSVSTKFNPAPNEEFLIDVAAYPVEFSKQLANTLNQGDAVAGKEQEFVVEEIVLGRLKPEAHDADGLFSANSSWVPRPDFARKRQSDAPSKIVFTFDNDPIVWVERAIKWINRPGKAFYTYTHLTLKKYLGEDEGAKELQDRYSKFQSAFTKAFQASAPLVSLNSGLLLDIHQRQLNDHYVLMSKVPFDKSSKVFEIIEKQVKAQYPTQNVFRDDWFDSGYDTDNIEIFTQLKSSVQPLVMTSLMEPLVQAWNVSSSSLEGRQDFLKWKTARPLFDTIPTSTNKKRSMIRGWFAARTLGLIKSDKNMQIGQQEVSVWTPGKGDISAGFSMFPFPMLAENTSGNDLLGPILKSMILAIAEVASTKKLSSLHPYHRLMDLDPKLNANNELKDWITDAKLSKDSPIPDEKRAGTASGTLEDRKKAVITFLTGEKESFLSKMDGDSESLKLRNRPLIWEIRTEVVNAIDELCDLVSSFEEEVSGA